MSGGFDWVAMRKAGLAGLGLSPEVFWRLSPVELLTMLGETGAAPMGRSTFDALAARFPDVIRATDGEAEHDGTQ